MQHVYKNTEEYSPSRQCNVLIAFDDMVADMISNKKLSPIVTELFIRVRKLNISLVFIMQSYFAVPKNIRLNSKHYFIMKIPRKQQPQQIAFSHSSHTDFKDLWLFTKNAQQIHILFWWLIVLSR